MTSFPWPRPALARVRGRSMLPTYRDGDLLLVGYGATPRAECAALVQLPPDRDGRPRPLSVKRLRPAPGEPGRWWVDSDNAADGVTSFDIGSIGPTEVVAVVWCRLPGLRGGGGASGKLSE